MKNVEISTEEYERLKDLENKRKMAQNQRNKHISENYKRASITIKNEIYNGIKNKYGNNITLNGYVNNLINKDINNIDVNTVNNSNSTAGITTITLDFPTDKLEEALGRLRQWGHDNPMIPLKEYAVDSVVNRFCGLDDWEPDEDVQNAQISPETLADDNLSMQEEKTLKTANNAPKIVYDDSNYTKEWGEMTEEERSQLPPKPEDFPGDSRYQRYYGWCKPLPFD